MKIGISSPYLNSYAGGERYILSIAECLANEHNTNIFWYDTKIINKAYEYLSINIKRANIVEDIFYSNKNILEKRQISLKYDLIIFLTDGSIPLSFAKKNILHFQAPFNNGNGKNVLNRIKLKKYNRFICNSAFTKKFVDAEYGLNSQVIYPPVDVSKFSKARKQKIILSVGRFSHFKQHKELIRCFKSLKNRLPGWKLIIAGGLLDSDKDYFTSLRKLAENSEIYLKPNIAFSELKNLYSIARIYWHAAGYTSNEYANPELMEHFGISTVEAMASGCVPVCFRGGGQKEIINHAKSGFLWDSTQELKKYTIELARRDILRRKISANALISSKKFSKKIFCMEINKLINEL